MQYAFLELAREETFTPQERDAIQRAAEEVDPVRRTIAVHVDRADRAEARAADAEARAADEAKAREDAEARLREFEALLARHARGE